jgi:CheY-like chemotaxis protein
VKLADIEDAVDAIAPSFAAKQIAIETRFVTAPHAIEGDAVRMRQVIDNLLSNALKFTPSGGSVVVATSSLEHTLAIQIADTGRGIEREFLPRLFVPFAQQDALLSREEGGLGLGLAIAREIIALHHGTLEAASEGTGRGATFTITLASAGRARAFTPPPLRTTGSLDGLRVMVVDDDHRVRSALGVLLTRAGASVRTAGSAAEALDLLAGDGFDALVCDIAMPGRDGNELMRELRTDGYRTPAIALTAHVTPTDVQNVRDAGFDMHLAKPVDIERLIAGIHVVITARAEG